MLPIPLPPELIVHVLSFVPGNDIRRFRAISKEFAAVLERNERYLHKPKLGLRFHTEEDQGSFYRYMTVSTDRGDVLFDVTHKLQLINDNNDPFSKALYRRFKREEGEHLDLRLLSKFVSERMVAGINENIDLPQILLPLPRSMNPGMITLFLNHIIKATKGHIDYIHVEDTLGRVMFYALCQFIWEKNIQIEKFSFGWVNSFHNLLQRRNISGKIQTIEKTLADRLDQTLGPDFTKNGHLNENDVRANALAIQFNVPVEAVYVWFGEKAKGLL